MKGAKSALMSGERQARTNASSCPESFAKWYCMNGATCFSLLIDESVLYNCWCRDGYHGARCDYKYTTKAVARPLAPEDQTSWLSTGGEAVNSSESQLQHHQDALVTVVSTQVSGNERLELGNKGGKQSSSNVSYSPLRPTKARYV